MARARLVLHLLQSQEQDRLGVESKTKAFTDSIMASRELAQQMVEDIAQLVLETRSKRELEDQTDCDVVELFGSASSEQSRLWQQWHLIVQTQGLPPVAVLAVWLRIIAVASTDFAFSLLSRYFACKTGDSRMAKERAAKPTATAAKKKSTTSKVTKTKKVSPYNMYIKSELAKVKEKNPGIAHKDAFKLAAQNWATAPQNPKVAAK
ncbi:hypothetical protein IWW40_001764 [Coemansia sp. RSA 1250]|nr:hypothetical protein IWW40_001764 [Coemansia sp. RSA 1250]